MGNHNWHGQSWLLLWIVDKGTACTLGSCCFKKKIHVEIIAGGFAWESMWVVYWFLCLVVCCCACFQYLKHSCLDDPGMDDVEGFKQLKHSMTLVGLSEKEQIAIFTVVAAVLHLGNIAFEENTESMKGARLVLICHHSVFGILVRSPE